MTIPGYTLTATVCEIGDLALYRATRIRDGLPVLIKVPVADQPAPLLVACLEREYELARDLDSTRIARPIAIERYAGTVALVLEAGPSRSLASLLGSPMDIRSFLRIAIEITAALTELHHAELIHKDIKPENVLLDDAGHVWLAGLGMASRQPRERLAPERPEAIAGTLAYMAPEQTGRMNRSVDSRSDLYALGVTFYQMLTGVLPFAADDPMEWVHCHIARQPAPPNSHVPGLPEPLSAIVMKLLAKMAEERYQSTWGLRADLEKCLRALNDEGRIPAFELGLEDFSDQLRFSEKLYGREEELDQLLHAFERVSQGECELLLVAGYSGVGKTRLVREIHKTVIEKQGYLIEGKFEQLQRNVPYFAWIQAFEELVNYLLMGGEADLAQWKQKISKAVGSIGKVLTDVVPNLELIIGPQHAMPGLGGVEAQNRFNYVFLEFVKAITSREHPLVIFLDDLQWIEAASLKLLETLMADSGVSRVLVIGAYRDNEVDALHPLTKAIDTLRANNKNTEMLTLRELSESTVNDLIAETLHRERFEVAPLAHLIHAKTGGNPFFMLQTIKALVEEHAISFVVDGRSWTWDVPSIEKLGITDNVATLMAGKIRQLPPKTQRLLPLAACMGFKFSLSNLSIIARESEEATLEGLQPAIHEGLIVAGAEQHQFVHDRVQQAAYSLIPETGKKQVHLEIGRLLLDRMPEGDHEEQIFAVTDHLNVGSDLIKASDEKLQLARLNLRAGSKAKVSAAFAAAAKYFEAGVMMLDADCWTAHYELALELHERAAEAESLVGGFERTDRFFDIVTRYASTAVDMVGVYESKMNCYILQGKVQEALDTALQILEKLGLSLPSYPSATDIAQAMEETKSLYANIRIEDLGNLPEMTDKGKLAIARILSKSKSAAYIGRPGLHPLLVLNGVNLAIRYGNAIESPYNYASYAITLCGLQRDYETGYRFGRLALALLEAMGSTSFQSKTLDVIAAHVWHFREHLRTTLPYLEKGYHSGLETGDLEYASYNAAFYCCNSYFAGTELHQLEHTMASYDEAAKRIRSETASRCIRPFLQAVRNLRSTSGNPCRFDGEAFNEQEMLPVLERAHSATAMAIFHVNKLVLCYLFGENGRAFECAELVEKNKRGMVAMYPNSASIFYDSLTRLRVYPDRSSSEQALILEKVAENQRIMKGLADSAPMNFLHKYCLVEAERHRLAGEVMAALDLYDKAIVLARENGYVQEAALANELAARFWLEKDKQDIARTYMAKALRCYESWGAVRKVIDLKSRYSYLLDPPLNEREGSVLELLDLSTLMKASRAISGVMEMDKLLGDVMNIVIENAGAQCGFLLVEKDAAWQIAAQGGSGLADVKVRLPVGMDECDLVARSVVHFVARTKGSLVLEDAANSGEFVNDPHVRHVKTRSLMCAPLMGRGRLVGILYLENNLTTHAFTPERVQLLDMLLSQAAISLENALVYEALRASEQRYRLSQDIGHVGNWEYNIQTSRFWESDEAKRIYGFDPSLSDFSTEEVESCIPERERVHRALVDLIEKGKPYNLEYEIRPRGSSGSRIVASIADVQRDEQGNPKVILGVVLDITERKRAEGEILKLNQELEQRVAERTAQLEAANKAKSLFLSNMSHELRTPLNAILGFSSMMRRSPQVSESQAESLDIINRSGEHLLALINDVLEVAKIEAGRVKLELAPVDLASMVRDVADMMRLRAEEKGLQLLIDQSSEFPRYIRGDEARLRQILVNLVGNAVKFTKNGGVIIRLGVKQNHRQYLLMEIEDTGPGIGADDQQRIFQPFVQLAEGAGQKGTGLGLTITRQFVELMGGSIVVESTPGKGALFRVELPVELVGVADIPAAKGEASGEVVGLAPGQAAYRILIAEDQPENQLLLAQLMEDIGLETRVVENGEQCVQVFQDWRPDLIWMDRRMPVMDGMEATRRIRQLPGGDAVKIVAVTAAAFKEEQQEVLAAGMDDFVSKPYRFGEIYDCLARQLQIEYLRHSDTDE